MNYTNYGFAKVTIDNNKLVDFTSKSKELVPYKKKKDDGIMLIFPDLGKDLFSYKLLSPNYFTIVPYANRNYTYSVNKYNTFSGNIFKNLFFINDQEDEILYTYRLNYLKDSLDLIHDKEKECFQSEFYIPNGLKLKKKKRYSLDDNQENLDLVNYKEDISYGQIAKFYKM
jgi:hypothetical protein